jgi:nucleoid-associated protein YgaU
MGLFSFLKDTGAKLFGHKHAEAAVAGAAAPDAATLKLQKEAALVDAVKVLGLQVSELSVEFDDATDTATVYGNAETQSEKEKAILAIGNVEGVSSVDDRMSVNTPEPEATFYQVQKGDSLSKIAIEVYGDWHKYPLIFEANKPMLTDPDLIYPGQVLRIPPLPA